MKSGPTDITVAISNNSTEKQLILIEKFSILLYKNYSNLREQYTP